MIWVLGLVAARPNWPIMLPFVILLVAIALAPLIAQYHWERHYHKLCVALAGIVCLYHLFIVKQSARVVHAGIDYATFMVVVGSFFVVAGGIHLRVKSPSGAMRNTLFLFVGALLGNLIGTIGASILLIRPWIAMNKGRAAPMHIAFFIFLVSNIGGALLSDALPFFPNDDSGFGIHGTIGRQTGIGFRESVLLGNRLPLCIARQCANVLGFFRGGARTSWVRP